jgi:phosphoglycerate dehydrogenase-like enzyme
MRTSQNIRKPFTVSERKAGNGKEHPHIVIGYAAGSARRSQYKSLFPGGERVCFLADLTGQDREQELADAEILLTWNPARELKPKEFSLLRKLRMIQLLSAGADHVPYQNFSREVVIASNIGAYSEPIAEHVLGMALALAKHLFPEHLKLAQGEFSQTRHNTMLHGAVCGILGFGGIGKATARLIRCLGTRIHAVNTSGATDEPVNFIGTLRDLGKVLASSDILVISLPLTKFTRGLIGKRELDAMKRDAILINVARGDIIDERALYEHLVEHPNFRAGIDAWWFEPFGQGAFRTRYPFFTLPNVLGSPHNSAIVPGMNEEGTRLAVQNVKRFLAGEPIVGVVRREDYI